MIDFGMKVLEENKKIKRGVTSCKKPKIGTGTKAKAATMKFAAVYTRDIAAIIASIIVRNKKRQLKNPARFQGSIT